MTPPVVEKAKASIEKLRRQRQMLIETFDEKRAPDFLLAHTRLFDLYFRERYTTSVVGPKIGPTRNPCAVIALGGYGRQEQCIHSDIDLLFLFEKQVPKIAGNLVEEMLYPLWDMRVEVGHATRSISDCLDEARAHMENLTAMLDARFICGMTPLATELETALQDQVLAKQSDQVLHELVTASRRRHHRFGDSTHLLQPNLKEGHGGLRDYHTALWMTRINAGVRVRRDLLHLGCLSHSEFLLLEDALAFIWHVRNHLHQMTNRKCDQLHFDFQEKLAHRMGFVATNGQRPVEQFLGELHGKMEWLRYLVDMFLYEHDRKASLGRIKVGSKLPEHRGLVVEKGMLNFRSVKAILEEPALLMNIFQSSAQLSLPLKPEAKRLVREFSYLVDGAFRQSPVVMNAFEQILVTPSKPSDVLNEMLDTGFLIHFLPEFKPIRNRILYNMYHLYSVDRHSVKVVQNLKSFGTPDDTTGCRLCADLYKKIPNKKLLCWAALLHDIAKGPGRGHASKGAVIAQKILGERGMSPKGIETVTFLIREHLFFVHIAIRRDIQDEETVIYCARHIKSLSRLKMLYLLSVADSAATGPKAWNEWTAALMQELFIKTANILEKGELASGQATRMLEKKKATVFASVATVAKRRDLEAIFETMSPRYLRHTTAPAILAHIDLYRSLKTQPYVWEIARSATKGIRTVTICTQDHPGLFATIAGVFTLNRIDILKARIYTWRNNIALDIFEVTAPPDRIFEKEKWAKAGRDLGLVLTGRLDLAAALRKRFATEKAMSIPGGGHPFQMTVDNKSSSFFTIIEVLADSIPGLLYVVTNALYQCQLDIWVAKIATAIDQVVGTFYIRDLDGRKIDSPKTVTHIKRTIKKAISRSLQLKNKRK